MSLKSNFKLTDASIGFVVFTMQTILNFMLVGGPFILADGASSKYFTGKNHNTQVM